MMLILFSSPIRAHTNQGCETYDESSLSFRKWGTGPGTVMQRGMHLTAANDALSPLLHNLVLAAKA
jgi:hypothetical protein